MKDHVVNGQIISNLEISTGIHLPRWSSQMEVLLAQTILYLPWESGQVSVEYNALIDGLLGRSNC